MNNLEMVNLHDTIISRLRTLQNEHGYSNKYVAKHIGISDSMYSQWFHGKTDSYGVLRPVSPTISQLIRLADLYDCTIDYLVGYQGKRALMTGLSEDTINNIVTDTRNLGTLASTLNTLIGSRGKLKKSCCRFLDDLSIFLRSGACKFFMPDNPTLSDSVFIQTEFEDISLLSENIDSVLMLQLNRDLTDIKNAMK